MGGCGSSAGQGRREEGLSSAFVDNTTEDVVDTSHEVWAAFTPLRMLPCLFSLLTKEKTLIYCCVLAVYLFLISSYGKSLSTVLQETVQLHAAPLRSSSLTNWLRERNQAVHFVYLLLTQWG